MQRADLTKANNAGYANHAKTLRIMVGSGVLIILRLLAIVATVGGFNRMLRLAPMLLCAVLNASVGTALRIFRDPGLRFPLGRGAGPILIAGCGGKLCASFSKNACRFGYNI
jgi:hypothetical protein